MEIAVVYRILNVATDAFYIGSTRRYLRRKWEHVDELKHGRHHCVRLQAAWAQYGPDAFVFEVLEEVAELERLLHAEEVWLQKYAGDPLFYNSAPSAFSPPASTPEARKKIAATLRERYGSDVALHPRYGKLHSDETKAKISASRTGKMAGDRHYRFGQTLSAEVREKIGAAQRGVKKAPRVLTEEGRAKIRAAAAAGHYASFTGKRHTEDAKAKMSQVVQTISPEGVTTTYPSITALREALGLKAPTVNRALKSGLPLTKGPFRGWTFKKRSTP